MGAFYRASFCDYLSHQQEKILGTLSSAYQHQELKRHQIKAWEAEIALLKKTLPELISSTPQAKSWEILLEYSIPRRRKRLDAVILADDLIFCIEFKTGENTPNLQSARQVEDYALDLRDFHKASFDRVIIPIVVASSSTQRPVSKASNLDLVRPVLYTRAEQLSKIIASAYRTEHRQESPKIDTQVWNDSPYYPIPSIIEAAEMLFSGHNVTEIDHSYAGTDILKNTAVKLLRLIQDARKDKAKVICFVTGVPGAGKTLAGLKIVHDPALRKDGSSSSVFLSGNGPLVKIVSTAIARDYKLRKEGSDGIRTVGTLIQSVHTFIREGLEKPDLPPVETVVIFDEAQRAWNANQNLLKNGYQISEPETLLSIMDRHEWAVVIALVGGGQEINRGEAGLEEWGKTLKNRFQHWKIAVSPRVLRNDTSLAGHKLFDGGEYEDLKISEEPDLHLNVNMRSFRAEKLTQWVDAILANTPVRAHSIISELSDFPLIFTRSLDTVRSWLRQNTRGLQRSGLVASSGAIRLRAEGIELSSGFRQGNRDMYINWFLNEPADIRSSNQLEVAASEFECQGLELDWVGVCWGGDFSFDEKIQTWIHKRFSGSKWLSLRNEIDRAYLVNTYRVLLTRARRGLIIWVPQGDRDDITRHPDEYNGTAKYLKNCGLIEV